MEADNRLLGVGKEPTEIGRSYAPRAILPPVVSPEGRETPPQCYFCGSTDHFSPRCQTPDEPRFGIDDVPVPGFPDCFILRPQPLTDAQIARGIEVGQRRQEQLHGR